MRKRETSQTLLGRATCSQRTKSEHKLPMTILPVLAALCLCQTAARAQTGVLTNPGFETGDFTGWSFYGSHAVESTNSIYYNGGQPGGSNVLTHSGRYVGKTYGSFTGSLNVNGVYQDV